MAITVERFEIENSNSVYCVTECINKLHTEMGMSAYANLGTIDKAAVVRIINNNDKIILARKDVMPYGYLIVEKPPIRDSLITDLLDLNRSDLFNMRHLSKYGIEDIHDKDTFRMLYQKYIREEFQYDDPELFWVATPRKTDYDIISVLKEFGYVEFLAYTDEYKCNRLIMTYKFC